jgi:hypothetical protein
MGTESKIFAPLNNIIVPARKGNLIYFVSLNSPRKHKENKLHI